MKKLLLIISLLFSTVLLSATPVLTYHTDANGLIYKRQRFAFSHNEDDEVIIVKYKEWVENSSGTILIKKTKKEYQLDGSYYYELSLAASGGATIAGFLASAIDARLTSTTGHVQDAIEAGRSQKNADMLLIGWTP